MTICKFRRTSFVLALAAIGLMAHDVVLMPSARSATMAEPEPSTPPPAATAAPLTPEERLQRLVPERIGAWKRLSLGARLPARVEKADPHPEVEAEFGHDDQRASLSVSDAGADAAPPYRGAPQRTVTDEGREATYHEEGATVLEKVRRIDGAARVTLLRDDGIVIVVSATGIAPVQLKRLARGIRPRAAMDSK